MYCVFLLYAYCPLCYYKMFIFVSCYPFYFEIFFFSDICMDIPVFVSMAFSLNIIFHTFTLSLCLSLQLSWVFWGQHIVGSYFLIHLATLCLLISEFSLFTFKVIINIWGLPIAISVLFPGCFVSIVSFYLSSANPDVIYGSGGKVWMTKILALGRYSRWVGTTCCGNLSARTIFKSQKALT